MGAVKKHFDFLVILPLFFFLFSHGLFSEPLWDDYAFIFNSGKLTDAPHPLVYWDQYSGYTRSWPLGYSIFWVLYKIFSHHYIFYKICNFVLHFFNYLLLKKIGRHYKLSHKLINLSAFFFLIHPLQVESLSWIFQMNTILSLTCFLLSICIALRGNKHRNYIASFLLFLSSLLIKSYYVAFCFLFFFIIKKKLSTRILYTLLFCGSALYMTHETLQGVRYSGIEVKEANKFYAELAVEQSEETVNTYRENTPSDKGSLRPFLMSSISISALVSQNFFLYLVNFLFPLNLNFIYPKIEFANPYLFILLFFIIIFIVSFLSNAPEKIVLITVILAFIPISGIFYIPFMKYAPISDHWAYSLTPSLCFLLVKFVGYLKKDIFFLSLTFYFTFLTFNYGKIFNNHETMLLRNIRNNPSSAFLYSYLAYHYKLKGNYSDAYKYAKTAVAKEPSSYIYRHMLNTYKKLLEHRKRGYNKMNEREY